MGAPTRERNRGGRCLDCLQTGDLHPLLANVLVTSRTDTEIKAGTEGRLPSAEFVRSARAIGVLWAICTLCLAIIEVVILVQPSWIGTADTGRYHPAAPSGTLGLFEVCIESDWPVLDCRGGLSSLSPLPSFQSVAVLVGVSLWTVWTSLLCLCLFRFCSAATVYKICAWLQLTAGFCLALACLLFPDSWDSPEMRSLCGHTVSSFSSGTCSVHWAYILAILGVLDAGILATLAFVLANRQDALLPPETKDSNDRSNHQPADVCIMSA
ncbi:LHFPL tetraspan subfamily member 3 protein isoform X2 [Cynoglossus semilaevis]|uniref:LHFPL tetraspan subfamily member 3 protein isoform X2 n=1 Tax=Cynoglossus semilaevis TaxID=244447 RepID=UPI000D623C53|nr:LHFPL tetraspan subfamily member 3 protein-like isoform X2 [Cynoglossus semilaevis]